MKRVAAAVLVAGFSFSAFAQTGGAPPAPPAPTPVPAAPDAEAVKKAEQLIASSAKAYADAKAITDTITFQAKGPSGEEKETMRVWLQGADVARLTVSGMTITALGQSLFVERDNVTDKYAEFAGGGNVAEAIEQHVGFAPPQLAVRGNADMQNFIDAFTFRMLPMAKINGHSMKAEGGEQLHEITLVGQGGEGAILINPKSLLVQRSRIHVKPEGAPEGFELDATLTYAPEVTAALAPAIAFDPGARQKVSSIEDLRIDLTGKPAPDFTLEDLDGNEVTLSDLKGSMVVLDFWATWCGPCKMALPKLQEFTTWAKDNKKPVKVYAVDVWERTKGAETRTAVAKFWKDKGYTMPTLLDGENKTAGLYGFDSIPTTIIVDPEGKVFRVHTGYNEDMVAELQKDLEEVMAKSGK